MPYEIRNCRYNADGNIDLEINHPVYGWVGFTASANDPVEHGRQIYAQALLGEVAPYVPPEG